MTQTLPGTKGTDRLHYKDIVDIGVDMSTFTNVTLSGTTTATTGSCTANGGAGILTTQSLVTTAGASFTITVANSLVTAGDLVWAQVGNGTNTAGQPNLANVTVSAGQFVASIQNIHGSTAFGGTLTLGYQVLKAAPAQN